MNHHHKRKSDDDALYANPSKRARLAMVPDSTVSSIQSTPSTTNEANVIRCAQETTVAPPQTPYHHLPPLNNSVLSTSVHISTTTLPPSPSSSSKQVTSQVDLFPPITRETLKELDLEVVLRHPQLRHDFLFDSGLQFRTMSGGRKQFIADQYWETVLHELEGTLDQCKHGRKRTRPPTPPPWSEKHYSAYLHAATDPQVIDTPARPTSQATTASPLFGRRVPALLHALAEVLTYVIGSAAPERNSPLTQLLSNIDILFIDHELRHGLYDPKGLFILMGQLLKAHCAPMRDGKVDIMVAVAKGDLNPSGLFGPHFSTSEFLPFTDKQRSVRRTIASLRLCFEILEVMKLDIANHHLHHLRPFLLSSGPEFLHRAFIDKVQRGATTLGNTQKFLNNAYRDLMATLGNEEELPTSTAQAILVNLRDTCKIDISAQRPLEGYPQGFKIHLALIASLTDMIFNPPTFDSYVCQCGLVLPMRDFRLRTAKNYANNQHVHEFRRHSSTKANQSSWPETLWLDSNRVAQLIGDAADLTALYVLLMGWRMLVFAKQDNGPVPGVSAEHQDKPRNMMMPPYTRSASKLEDWEIDRVKKEVWSIAPRKFGSCFFWDDYSRINGPPGIKRPDALNDDQARQVWKDGMENVALHIAIRAEDTRQDDKIVCEGDPSARRAPRLTRMPSYESISLLRSWLDTHMQRSSPLTARLRKLIATEVAVTAAKMTLHMVSASLPFPSPNSNKEDGPQTTPQDSIANALCSTSTASLYNTSTFPEIRRASIPSLLSPNPSTSRIPPLSHPISPHRPINIIPSPAAVSAGLEPLMPEIKHLASRIAKLAHINMKIFWSLYTAPGFLDVDVDVAPTPPIATPDRRRSHWEPAVKLEED